MQIELHSAEKVAELLGVEVDTLYRYARKGKIRAMKVGKAWRFAESDLRDFLQQQCYTAPGSRSETQLLTDILDKAAAETGAQGGITCQGVDVSYAEVKAAVERLAERLLKAGIGPGDRVLLLLSNSLEFVIGCFGIWKTGAILVPEDPAIKDDSLLHILRDCSPAALIVERSVAERLDTRAPEIQPMKLLLVKDRTFALSGFDHLTVESLDALLEDRRDVAIKEFPKGAPTDVASITYTSGTTGRPKGVMHTHESWLAGAAFTREYHNLGRRDTIVQPLPPHHGLAFRQILAYVWAGGRILLASDIYQALKLMRERKPNAAVLVPAGVNILLTHFAPVISELSDSLRYMEIGSAALAPERLDQLRRLLPNTAIHLPYGLTEARVGFLKAGADGQLNRIAKVSPNLELSLIDENGAVCVPGQPGQIVLKGPGLMKGYWGQGEAQIIALKRDGFRTGDMAMIDERGEIALLGRIDEMLKVGGHKVNPAEVESILKRHPGVAECAVVGLTDPEGVFETKLHAFIVAAKSSPNLGTKELEAHCRGLLESYKIPAQFHFQQSLPRSAVGKILRQALRDSVAETLSQYNAASQSIGGTGPGTAQTIAA